MIQNPFDSASKPSGSDSPAPEASDNPCAIPDWSGCIQSLGLSQIQRHLLLCADPTIPKCCAQADGLQTWNYLKQRLKDLALDRPSQTTPFCIYRTKVNCLRICQQGPILLVYPDGVWYANVTPTVMERILQEHILGNQIVTEYMFLQQPLPIAQSLIPASPVTDINEIGVTK